MRSNGMERLTELYCAWHGSGPVRTERLAGAGSNRAYYRMADSCGHTVIGCVGTSREENDAFIYLSRHFAGKQLPVPHVLACSDDRLCYLQTDLGGTSLFDAVREGREAGGRYSDGEKELLRSAVRLLPRLQFVGGEGLDYSRCHPKPLFDEEGIFFDLNYFKYCYLKATGTDFNEVRLEADFRSLARDLLSVPSASFLHRDFQARNVMLCPTGPFFIDFQGGRRGPFYYDLASFLWQASARYPESLRRELATDYYLAAQQLNAGAGPAPALYAPMPPRKEFDDRLRLFVLFRTLQVLGAYGFRGCFEGKRHFIDSIAPALDNLRRILADGACPYPYLHDILAGLSQPRRAACAAPTGKAAEAPPPASAAGAPLVVRIFSFSYKKGIPSDESGNGGGYVFDCRSTHNPGRYEAYREMTGMDEPVVRFLEDDGEILTFLESVYRLADAHVERYMQRGFTSLMFSFGCTGGQHRSVYSAQRLAEHLNSKYGIEVRLCHREQGVSHTFPKQGGAFRPSSRAAL